MFKGYNTILAVFFTLTATLFTSCVFQKNIKYLQPRVDSKTVEEFPINEDAVLYKIEKGDILSIQVNSTVATDIDIIDKKFKTDAGASGEELAGYDVDQQGFVTMPLLGKIKLEGLTMSEASDTLKKLFQDYIKYVDVKVKMKGLKFVVLGEVGKPGEMISEFSKINVLNAIALSGDFTYYSNRKNVKIIRKENNINKIYTIDFTDKSILSSDKYYIKPNDVIIVDVKNSKLIQENLKTFSTYISIVSVAFLLFLRTKNIY